MITSTPARDPALAGMWRDLQDAGAVPSPFLRWEWFSAFADVPDVAAGIRVLVASRAGRALGLFPVEQVDDRLRTVGCAGWRWLAPDHLDVVALPADREAVAAAVAHHLLRGGWDLLDLDGLAAEGALAAALARAARLPRAGRLPSAGETCPYVSLAGRDPAQLLPSRNLRRVVTGYRLPEETRRGGGFSVVRAPDEVAALLPTLMELHNDRYRATSQVFASPARRHFHQLVARRLAAAGRAVVFRLRLSDTDAALIYGLLHDGRVFAYSQGIRSDLGRSPGVTVEGQAILWAAAAGFVEYDMLRGDHAEKRRFTDESRDDVRLRLLAPTVRSAGAALRHVVRRGAARLRPSA